MADITTYRLALVGFGSVGQGLAQILRYHSDWLARRYGVALRIVALGTRGRGNLYDPQGLDPALLLEELARENHFHNLEAATNRSILELLGSADADILVEASPTNLESAEPASSYIRVALGRGMHVVTANKGPIALNLSELRHLAADAGAYLGFEGTVMSGTPALRLAWSDLAGCEIIELSGIVNGTTNYILSQMEQGRAYDDALAEAQQLGYAEADPSGDVDGYDAAVKALILANIVMDADLQLADVERSGMSHISQEMVADAALAGERWKLLARVWRENDRVRASVAPIRLPQSHPLANVGGVTNAITFTTDLLGDVTLIGPGAGGVATGFALISDILAMHLLWRQS